MGHGEVMVFSTVMDVIRGCLISVNHADVVEVVRLSASSAVCKESTDWVLVQIFGGTQISDPDLPSTQDHLPAPAGHVCHLGGCFAFQTVLLVLPCLLLLSRPVSLQRLAGVLNALKLHT